MAALKALLDLVTDFNYNIDRERKFQGPLLQLCALHFCFAAYYVLSISFPVDFRFVLLFLEKYNYVYALKSSQNLYLSLYLLIVLIKH